MNIKKILAGSLAAITAGATLAFGAFGAGLGDYVTTSDGTLTSPMIVVGDTVPGSDVIGAADIAAAVAGYATTTSTVGSETTAVSGGIDLATTNTKLFLQDTNGVSTARNTLTSSDLPTILASGQISVSGVTYKYDHYLNLGSQQVTYGKSGGTLTDPALYLDIGTSTATPVYNTTVVFNKALNLSHSRVRGKKIAIFGKDYTIGSSSVSSDSASSNKLELFGYGITQTLIEAADPITVTIGGGDHSVKLLLVDNSANAKLDIDGEVDIFAAGDSGVLGGVNIYVKTVSYLGGTRMGQADVSFGSEKLTLQHGQNVKTGESATSIDGTEVSIVGDSTGITKLSVAISADDSSNDQIVKGESFTDPVWGTFKTAFGGMTPALDSSARETITLDNSGTSAATVKFTDYRGNEKTLTFVRNANTNTWAPALNWSSSRSIHVLEGEEIAENDYVVLAQGDFSHFFLVSDISSIGTASEAKVTLSDVFSGDSVDITLANGYNGTAYIDGQTYYLNATSSAVKITWGAGATFGSAGTQTTVFPMIKTSNEAEIAFIQPGITLGSASGIDYYMPGSATAQTITNDTVGLEFGQIVYNFTAGATETTLITVGGVNVTTDPALLIYEEKGKNVGNTEVQDAIVIRVTKPSATPYKTTIDTPVLTAATSTSGDTLESDTSVTKFIDRYGILVTHDSDGEGLATISYPDDQASVNLAMGSNPSFTTAGGGVVEVAIKITNPVAKFANEVSPTAPGAHLILVGGPCANTLVETLLAAEWNVSNACSDWIAGRYTSGQGIIKEITGGFTDGSKALIVAGTNAADTRKLAARVMTGTTSYSGTA